MYDMQLQEGEESQYLWPTEHHRGAWGQDVPYHNTTAVNTLQIKPSSYTLQTGTEINGLKKVTHQTIKYVIDWGPETCSIVQISGWNDGQLFTSEIPDSFWILCAIILLALLLQYKKKNLFSRSQNLGNFWSFMGSKMNISVLHQFILFLKAVITATRERGSLETVRWYSKVSLCLYSVMEFDSAAVFPHHLISVSRCQTAIMCETMLM